MIIPLYDFLNKIYNDIKTQLKFEDNFFFLSFIVYIKSKVDFIYIYDKCKDKRLWMDDKYINTLLDLFQDFINNNFLDYSFMIDNIKYEWDDNYKDKICNIIQNYKVSSNN